MIEKSVVLACDAGRAFSLFTSQAGLWWPADRRHTADEASTIRIEASGRFFERARDGTEAELGVVRRFEPPYRLLLDWYPGTGPAHPTRVDVRFEAVEGGTRVTVRHDEGVAGAHIYARNAPRYAAAWDAVLSALAAQARG